MYYLCLNSVYPRIRASLICVTTQSDAQPWGKLISHDMNLLSIPAFYLSTCNSRLLTPFINKRSALPWIISVLHLHCYSPAVSPGCIHQTGFKTLFSTEPARLYSPYLWWNLQAVRRLEQESQTPIWRACPCYRSTFRIFSPPRHIHSDWILWCEVSPACRWFTQRHNAHTQRASLSFQHRNIFCAGKTPHYWIQAFLSALFKKL